MRRGCCRTARADSRPLATGAGDVIPLPSPIAPDWGPAARILRWTVGAAAFVWALMWLVYTTQHLPCTPIFSSRCGARLWSAAGWVVQFGWVKDWGGFVGSLLALAAALIGAWFLHRQITLAERQEAERLARRRAAARAALPSGLSEIVRICRWNLANLLSLALSADGRVIPNGTPVEPFSTLDPQSRQTFLDMIEVLDTDQAQEFAALLARIQVVEARLEGMVEALAGRPPYREMTLLEGLYGRMADIAEIYVRVSNLFPYARGQSEVSNGPIARHHIAEALSERGLLESEWPELYDLVARQYAE